MLEELRKKSKSTKEAYAFWGALIVTGVIGVVWAASLPVRLSDVGNVATVESATEGQSALSQFFKKAKENFSETWQKNKEVLESISEETPSPPLEAGVATSAPAIIIATTSAKSIIIATTSEQTR